jgi:hypothetical protein
MATRNLLFLDFTDFLNKESTHKFTDYKIMLITTLFHDDVDYIEVEYMEDRYYPSYKSRHKSRESLNNRVKMYGNSYINNSSNNNNNFNNVLYRNSLNIRRSLNDGIPLTMKQQISSRKKQIINEKRNEKNEKRNEKISEIKTSIVTFIESLNTSLEKDVLKKKFNDDVINKFYEIPAKTRYITAFSCLKSYFDIEINHKLSDVKISLHRNLELTNDLFRFIKNIRKLSEKLKEKNNISKGKNNISKDIDDFLHNYLNENIKRSFSKIITRSVTPFLYLIKKIINDDHIYRIFLVKITKFFPDVNNNNASKKLNRNQVSNMPNNSSKLQKVFGSFKTYMGFKK